MHVAIAPFPQHVCRPADVVCICTSTESRSVWCWWQSTAVPLLCRLVLIHRAKQTHWWWHVWHTDFCDTTLIMQVVVHVLCLNSMCVWVTNPLESRGTRWIECLPSPILNSCSQFMFWNSNFWCHFCGHFYRISVYISESNSYLSARKVLKPYMVVARTDHSHTHLNHQVHNCVCWETGCWYNTSGMQCLPINRNIPAAGSWCYASL